ncbi:MAG: DegT/DnrJ/EryC1/StrS family aminotransferase [Gemmatimonadales bacterium]
MTEIIARPARAARAEFLPFSPPAIGEEEIREVVDTLRSPWITTGPKTRRFEEEFAAFVGAPAGALAVNSCTAAMHTALACLGIGPGDEVITTPLTFTATANVIEHVGARPVFADVEPDTLNIDPAAVARAITPRTRALLPVHYAGHPAECDALAALAQEHGLALVEDAAHALPARFRGRPIGSGSNPVAFSFYATKNLTTAEGGMLTGEPALLERARILALHGLSRDAWKRYEHGGTWRYEVVAPGFKYNMPDVQAAIGLWQLRKQGRFHARRVEIAAAYTRAFTAHAADALEPPVRRPHVEHAWHLYVLRLRPEALRVDRDRFLDELTARNIGTSVHFIPLHLHSYYRRTYGYRPGDFPVAFANFQRLLSLPLHPGLTDRDVADVIDAVLDVARAFQR